MTAAESDRRSPRLPRNRAVAVQNLFYLNNVIHDTLYAHGFNEAAGNFQIDNFGNGGAGNDPVNAEAQDGSGTDNANFATPADGSSPRMQMYLWNGRRHAPGGRQPPAARPGPYRAAGLVARAALTTTGITGRLSPLVNDGDRARERRLRAAGPQLADRQDRAHRPRHLHVRRQGPQCPARRRRGA